MTDYAMRRGVDLILHRSNISESDELLEGMLDEIFGQESVKQGVAKAFTNVERAKREWETTVDALPELICVVDQDGILVRANRTVERWSLGLVQAVKGQELHRFMHPNCDQPCYLSTFLQFARKKALRGQPVEHEDYDAILRRHLQIRVWPVRIRKHDAQQNLAIIVHDITKRKEIENALQRNNERLRILNTISGSILAAHSQGEIADAVLRHIRPLVPFKLAYILLLEADQAGYCVLAHADEHMALENPDFPLTPEMIVQSPGRGNDELSMVGDLHQCNERSRFEEELLRSGASSYVAVPLVADNARIGTFVVAMESLDAFEAVHIQTISEIAEMLTVAIRQTQLRRNLQETNAELQELLRVKHEILQDVSHELRSPLALIRGFTELLRDEVLGPLTEEQSRALDVLDSKGDQLFFMVKRLLTLNTAGEESLDKSPLALDDLLREELQAWQVPATNNGIMLTAAIAPGMPMLSADSNQIRQVITNLLDNAFKYSDSGSTIRVRAWCTNSTIAFSIADEGLGVSPEMLEHIFDRFCQAHKRAPQSQSGVGIGLALCKAIVEAHGGQIWAESGGEGKGSTFSVSLPIEEAASSLE